MLEKEIAARRRRREKLAAELAAEDATLAALLEAQARLIEAVSREEGLHRRVNSSTVNSEHMQVSNARSLAISKAVDDSDAFLKHIRAKGYTLRSLAAKVGCPPSLLSMQRGGDRPIPTDRAEKIEKLTGWPATAKGWPGGLA